MLKRSRNKRVTMFPPVVFKSEGIYISTPIKGHDYSKERFPEGTISEVMEGPYKGRKVYYSSVHGWVWDTEYIPPKLPNNKGEGRMSSKKWVWVSVIVAVVAVVIWAYRKFMKEGSGDEK